MVGKLLERKLVAKETFEMTFDLREKVVFSPGQFVTISLPRPKHEDHQLNQRIFSLVNSPTQNEVAKILFRFRDSGFKKNLVEMAINDDVEIDQPMGMFHLPEDQTTPLVFLATGVGVAPFLSVLSFLRERKSKREIIFFFSNYSPETTPYFQELKSFSKELINFELIPVMTRDNNWSGEKERISLQMIEKYLPEFTGANFYLAGLPEFVSDLVRQLVEVGVLKEKIVQESFDGY